MASKITVYGAPGCSGCVRARQILDRNSIAYEYIDLAKSPSAADKVIEINKKIGKGPFRSVPLIIIDGKILSEPSDEALLQAIRPQA